MKYLCCVLFIILQLASISCHGQLHNLNAFESVSSIDNVELSIPYTSLTITNTISKTNAIADSVDTVMSTTRRLEEFTYSNPDDTYKPSVYVTYGSQLTTEEFAINQKYGENLIRAPAALFILGLLAIVSLYLSFICRCCVECCFCGPNYFEEKNEGTCISNRTLNYLFFYLFLLLILIFDQLVFLGNQSVDSGITTMDNSISNLKLIFTDVVDDSNSLLTFGDTLESQYNSAKTSCLPAKTRDLSDDFDEFDSQVNSLKSALNPAIDQMDNGQTYIDEYGVFYREIGLYVLYALSIICVIVAMICHLCKTTCGIKFTIALSTAVFLLYLVLGIIWTIGTAALGDVCEDPSFNIIKELPDNDAEDSVRNLAVYYSTCVGSSFIINEYIEIAQNSTQDINSTVNELLTQCPGDSNLLDMRQTVGSMDSTIVNIDNTIECSAIQTIWFQLVNSGLCTDFYEGLFFIWGSQLITSFFIFLFLIVASITYQYYDVLQIVPTDDDDEEEEEEHDEGEEEEHHRDDGTRRSLHDTAVDEENPYDYGYRKRMGLNQ